MYQLGPKNWKLKYIPDLPGGNQRWRAGNLPFSQTKPPFVADFPATLDTLETLETMVHGGRPCPCHPGLPMNPKTCQAGISQVTSASDRDSHVKFSAVNDHKNQPMM
jgi:hypothetical protein